MKRLSRLAPLVLIVGLTTSPGSGAYVCTPGPFLLPRTFGAGQLNGPIATGDLNGDNHSDVVVVTDTGFSLLLGNGDGSFQLPSHVDSTQYFGSIAVGDLDGNGLLGVITGSYGSIFVYVSNGDGTFQSPVTFSRPNNGPIALGDFDGDHRIDIVSASESFPGSLSVFLGNGDGTFQPPTTMALSFEPTALAVGDFNGDHRDDVAVAPSTNCCPPVGLVDVLLGDGTGGFSEPLEYATGGGVRSLAAVDVDMDQHVDLAISVGGFVSVLLNSGDGTFDAPIEFEAPNSSGDLVAGDFDNDGAPDIAVLASSRFEGDVGFDALFGNGDGTILPSKFYAILDPLGTLVSADLNEDGRSDLAIVTQSDHVAVVNGIEGRDFEAEREFIGSFPVSFNPQPFSYGDFNGDGLTDIIATNGTDAFLVSGDANRGFHDPLDLHVDASLVAAGDFDGDGHPDLVVVRNGSAECDLLINDGLGNFSPVAAIFLPFGPNILATGDFNGDGNLDFIAAESFVGSAEVFLGDGQAGFVDAGAIALDTSTTSVVTADVNSDGRADLVLFGPSAVQVRLSSGNGGFQPPSFSAGTNPSGVAVADASGDGKPDLVVASTTTSLSVYPGNGDGTFQAPTVIGLAYVAAAVAAADFNGDGKIDLATSDQNGPGISVLIAKGNLTFFSPSEFAGAGNQLLAIDLTGGHHPDVFSLGPSGLAVIRNSHATVSVPSAALVACTNSTVHIVSHAAGRGPLSYQWRQDTIPLSDGGAILGSQSDTLTIQNPSPGESGSYDVVVTDACGSDTSDSTAVTVEAPPATPQITVPATVRPNTPGLSASAPFHSGDTYLWTNLLGSIDSGQGTSGISFTSPGPGLQMSFTVVDTNAGGCSSETGLATIQVDFLDVPPANPFHDFVDALALHGVTVGCGNGDYCPNKTLRRDEMAAFIARAAVGTPPSTGMIGAFAYDCVNGPSYFSDVAVGSTFCSHIHYLASQGITVGCSPQHFCPSLLVTRETMALFIGRAIAPSATPPSAYSDGTTGRSYDCSVASPFPDVAANTESCNAVGYIWAKGIVDGFGDGTFHPNDALTRAPAAKFIANAFGLTLGP